MTTEKAIQRLTWRFSEQKAFTPNTNDVEALNVIIEWMNKQHENRLKSNHHYAKLFMVIYIDYLRHYKEANLSLKEITKCLKKPLSEYYYIFFSELNNRKFLDTVDFLNIKDDIDLNDPEWNIDKMKQTISDNTAIVKENQQALLKSLETFSLTEITNRLNFIISESLHKYEDL